MWRRTSLLCAALILTACCKAQNDIDCGEGDVKLVGGRGPFEGTVQLCLSGEWGTICDDIWGSSNAQVVCNQLELNYSAAIAANRAYFGEGEGPIFLDNVDCTGDEERVMDCIHQGVENHNCGHHEDAGVYCQPLNENCNDGDIRLAGIRRQVENEGRVEICYRGQWGTVCDDLWDKKDAAVVCRQLGYFSEDAIAVLRAMYGQGIGEIYYDDVDCRGHEDNISDCRSRGLLVHNCQHSEDAGVLCKPKNNTSCHNGDLRLEGGRDSTEGRVEVCYNGRWGTVCDDLFGNSDARVICRWLGYPSGGYSQNWASFGEGTGPIFLDNLNCVGNETSLLDCRNDGVGFHNCLHTEDSSVVCKVSGGVCRDGSLRLRGGDFENEGRVEVCMNNHWGTICDSYFDVNDSRVICRQLGYSDGEAIPVEGAFFGAGVGMVWMEKLQCLGTERHILNCSRGQNSAYSSCRHSQDVSVICPVGDSEGRCSDGAVRLKNGSVPNEGLVEICFNGRWGAICQDHWDTLDATVLCRQLGYPVDSALPVGKSLYSSSSGPIFLDSVACKGTESKLTECFNRSSLGSHDCRDSKGHAGALCPATEKLCENGQLRLVDGGTLLEGRVEMCYNSRWGTVCDTIWDNRDASVVCRQIAAQYGLETTNFMNPVAVTGSAFGRGDGPIFLMSVRCVGSEESILECQGADVSIHDCNDHKQDAGVYCGLQPCEEGAVRLSAGLPGTNNTGRVELCVRNVWSAICDRQFDDQSAELVCEQLGLPSRRVIAVGGDFFGHGYLMPTWAVKYTCSGGACTLQPDSIASDCPHASVFCENNSARCTTGHVRLVGGANSSEGRVEVCLDGHWGKICDDSWDDNAATVVCRQLRKSTLGAKALLGSPWGSSPSLDYLLDDVKCGGSESELLDCHSSSVLSHNCLHTEEAGVTCPGKVYTSTTDQPAPSSDDGGDGGGGSEGEMYSSSQVAAIVVPILLAMMVVMVTAVVGMWLVLQWRKRSVKQSDQFPIISGQGIPQFNEFSNEEPDKIPPGTTAI